MGVLKGAAAVQAVIQKALTLGGELDVRNASSIAMELTMGTAGSIAALGSSVQSASLAGAAILVSAALYGVVCLVISDRGGKWLRTPAEPEQRRETLLQEMTTPELPRWLPAVGSSTHRWVQQVFTWGGTVPVTNAPSLARNMLNSGGSLLASGVAAMKGMPPSVSSAVLGVGMLLRMSMSIVASNQVGQWLRTPADAAERGAVQDRARVAYQSEFGPLPGGTVPAIQT